MNALERMATSSKNYWIRGKVYNITSISEGGLTSKDYCRIHTDIFNNKEYEVFHAVTSIKNAIRGKHLAV